MYPLRNTSLTPNVIKCRMINLSNPRPRARVNDLGQQAAPARSINNSNIRMVANSACSHILRVTPHKKGITL